MQQRVALAAALASDPEVLVADEPSTALDVTTQKEILALLRRVQEARGMGLVLITHDLRVAFSICRRIYVLYAGSVLEVAPGRRPRARAAAPVLARPAALRAVGRAALRGARGDRRLRAVPGRRRRTVPVHGAVSLGGSGVRGRRPAAARGRAGARVGLCSRRGDPRASSPRRGAPQKSARTVPSSPARTAVQPRSSASTRCARSSPPAGGRAPSRSRACRSRSARARASASSASRARERRRSRAASSGSRRRPAAASRSAASTQRITRGSTRRDAGSSGGSCR